MPLRFTIACLFCVTAAHAQFTVSVSRDARGVPQQIVVGRVAAGTRLLLLDGMQPIGTAVAGERGDAQFAVGALPPGLHTIRALGWGTGKQVGEPIRFGVPAQHAASLTGANTYVTGIQPLVMQTGDMDGDGFPDLILGGSGKVVVALNRGGVFSAPISIAAVGETTGIAVGDFNGDGRNDLAVACSDGRVAVLLNRGPGDFSPPRYLAAGAHPAAIVPADFNGDGIPDLATSNEDDDTVSILIGNGDGVFRPASTIPVGKSPRSLVVADFNGDGVADLATANFGGNDVSILIGDGHGGFGNGSVFAAGTGPGQFAVADFNEDGAPDLAVLSEVDHSVNLLLNDGAGTFFPGTVIPEVSSLGAADMNGDGHVDLIEQTGGQLRVWAGLGNGSFTEGYSVRTITPRLLLALDDFNRDGRMDAVGADLGGTLGVVLGTEAPAGASFLPERDGASSIPLRPLANGAAVTNITLASSVNPSVFGRPVTLTATVTPSAASGAVTFYDGATVLGLSTLSGGQAVLTTSLLPSGVRALKAGYAGNATYAASLSTVTPQTVSALFGNGLRSAVGYPAGFNPFSVAVGDFNGDEKADFVVADLFDGFVGHLSVLRGNGDGTFQMPLNTDLPGEVICVAVGDFNGDGKADVAAAMYGDGKISVLLGNGDGTFQLPVLTYATGQAPISIAVGDFNGDGKADLAVANESDNNVAILLGKGDGTFPATPVIYPTAGVPRAVVVADFNGDGKPDLAVAAYTNVTMLLGNGDGTFAAGVNYGGVGTDSYSLAADDFNGDGKADVAVVANGLNRVSILLGNGDGTLQTPVHYSVGTLPEFVATGDFNGDSKRDLAVSNDGENTVSLLYGNGDGTFLPGVKYATGNTPRTVAVGDFDRDGRADLAIANIFSNDVSVLLGVPATFTTLTGPSSGTSTYGKSVTLTASVFPAAATGAVTFYDGTTILGIRGVSNGTALLNTTQLPAGVRSITARYDGDTLYPQSFSAALPHTVNTVQGDTLSAAQPFNTTVFAGQIASQSSVAVGDLNGDGKPDVVVAGSDGFVRVLLGDGKGNLSAIGEIEAGFGISSVAFADFNGDGKLDFAVTNGDGHKVTTVLGKGDGKSAGTADWATGLRATLVVTGDFNGDGKADLAVAGDDASGFLSVLIGNGDGTFQDAAHYPSGSTNTALVTGDFNGDGKIDFALTNNLDVSIMLGNGDGTFQSPLVNSLEFGNYYPGIVVGDFNRDGKVDVAVADFNDDDVIVLLGKGDGTFQAPASYPAGTNPESLVAGDFNGDGVTDLAVITDGGNTVNVLYGNPNGTFQPPVRHTVASNPYLPGAVYSLVAGDFNGDGRVDLVVGGYANGYVSMLAGQRQSTLAMTTSLGHSLFGQSVTLTATVAPSDATGFVTFYRESVVLERKLLVNGQAALTTRLLDANHVPVIGYYAGDGGHTSSLSSPMPQDVVAAPATAIQTVTSLFPALGEHYVAVGDFNGDGRADLAVTDINNPKGTILLGNGKGAFPTEYPVDMGAGRQAGITTGDFDGDGNTDLAVANTGGTVAIVRGKGDGTFFPAVSYATGGKSADVRSGDFDGDGIADLVVSNSDDNDISLLLGNGDGTFRSAGNTSTGLAADALAVGDFNGDGYTDVAVANFNTTTVSILLGQPGGGFQSPLAVVVGTNPIALAVGDFNSDGKADLAIATRGDNHVTVVMGNSAGTFAALVYYDLGAPPASIAVADVDGDGKADLAVVANPGGIVSVLTGNGDGTFATPVVYSKGGDPSSVVAGEFDGDGRTDLAIAWNGSFSQSNIRVMLGRVASSITLASSANPSTLSQTVTLTATVSPSPATGTVIFYDGSTVLGTGLLSGGRAILTTGLPVPGMRSIEAYYGGDSTFGPAISPPLEQAVNAIAAAGFQLPVNFTTGVAPVSLARADFNGDGKADVAVAIGGATGSFDILLGNSDGTFQPASHYLLGHLPDAIAAGDFNGDGKSDLAIAYFNESYVDVLLGNGNGTFQQQGVNWPVGQSPNGIVVGDFDGDGKADIATANYNNSNVSILPGNGDGSFLRAVNFAAGTHPASVSSGDFNGDGKLDLVTANYGSNNVSVLLGAGDGTFQPAANFVAGSGPQSVTVGDLNGDGKPDLAVANFDGDNVSVMLGNGDGTFQTAIAYPVQPQPFAILVTDFNGDGKADLATANYSGSTSILLGNGNGTFQTAVNYGGPGSETSLTAGDFNADGRVDLVIGNEGGNSVSVLLGKPVVAAQSQTIVFGTLGNKTLDAGPFTIGATATSSLAVAFASGTLAVCIVSGNTVTLVTAGTCTITASQAGSANYAAAASVSQSFTVANVMLQDNFGVAGAQPDLTKWTTVTGDPSFIPRTQLADWITPGGVGKFVVGANGAQLTLNTFNPTGQSLYGTQGETLAWFQPAGDAVIEFTTRMQLTSLQPGLVYGMYFYGCLPGQCAAIHDEIDIELLTNTLQGAPLRVQLNRYAAEPLGAGNGGLVTLPTGFDPLTVHTWTIRWSLSRIDYLVDGTVLGSATDHVPQGPMQADEIAWGPNESWPDAFNAALQPVNSAGRNQAFTALLTAVTVAQTQGSGNLQALTFTPVGNPAPGASSLTVSATATSGLPVSFTSGATGVCTVAGSVVTIVAGGTCSITANQAGNANYLPAPGVTRSFTVAVPAPCDINADGSANVADVQLIINEALGVTAAVHDLNHDGAVNVADVQKVINAALGLGCSLP